MKVRMCNIYGCNGEMRPTRDMHHLSDDHRIFRCTVCGNKTPWVDKPLLNGSFGELHRVDGGSSGLSLMSDPNFYPTQKPERKRKCQNLSKNIILVQNRVKLKSIHSDQNQ